LIYLTLSLLVANSPAIPPIFPSPRQFPHRTSPRSRSRRCSEIFGATLRNFVSRPADRFCWQRQTTAAATTADRRDRSRAADALNLEPDCALRCPPHRERTAKRGTG